MVHQTSSITPYLLLLVLFIALSYELYLEKEFIYSISSSKSSVWHIYFFMTRSEAPQIETKKDFYLLNNNIFLFA